MRRKGSILDDLVRPQKKSEEFARERESYVAYVERVHRGKYVAADFHRLICTKLEAVERGEITRLMLFVPPRHGKSQTVTETFPSWYIGKHPDRRIIEVSYGKTFAEKFGRLNRRKVEEFGEKIFGVRVSGDNASKTNWSIEGDTGGMISVGLGGSITGEGADVLIIDDLIKNRQEAESPTMRKRIWSEWQDTLLTRLHPDATVILIMTRWRDDDLAGMILKQAEEEGQHWDIVSLPALAEQTDLLGRHSGKALWPEHGYDEKWAAKKRVEVGTRTWQALYQQNPAPSEGNILRRSWWRFYHVMPTRFDEILQSWDMTFKDKKDSDYVVGQIWGRIGADKYLLDQVREQLDFPKTLRAMRQMHQKWPQARVKLVEDKANGSGIIAMLRSEIPGIIAVNPEGGKEARVWAVSPDIEAGNVFLPKNAAFTECFIEECARFPAGKNDDQVDGMSQALARFLKRKRRRGASVVPVVVTGRVTSADLDW